MTEKKRFTVDYDITVGNYCLHDDCEAKGVDGYIAYLSDKERANNLCDLLNEYDSELQMCQEKVVYWRNKAKDIWGDMRTNVELEKQILELEKENKRLKLVVSEVIDAIIDDARVQLNEEFLEYADKFDSIDDLQNEVKKNLYDGDVE